MKEKLEFVGWTLFFFVAGTITLIVALMYWFFKDIAIAVHQAVTDDDVD